MWAGVALYPVLRLVATGMTSREIAARLVIDRYDARGRPGKLRRSDLVLARRNVAGQHDAALGDQYLDLGAAVVLLPLARSGFRLTRPEGALLLIGYVIYTAILATGGVGV